MDDKTFQNPTSKIERPEGWDLHEDPVFAPDWLDDLDEAIAEFERAVEEADEIIRLY